MSSEVLPYAKELKQNLLDMGLIDDWFAEITPEILTKAKTMTSQQPRGFYKADMLGEPEKVLSTTRLLDIADPSTYANLAKQLNKIAPVVATPVVATSMLDNKRDGGVAEAKLGDIVNKATMKRLKKLGYTLKKV